MNNPVKMLKLINSWDKFKRNHPKFPSFLKAVKNGAMEEGTIIEISVTTAKGKTINSNLKLTKSDIDLYHELLEHSNQV